MHETTFAVSREEIAALLKAIDYSEALTVIATEADVRQACSVCRAYGFRAAVTFPCYVPLMVRELAGSSILPQIVVGFPSGATSTASKCREAEEGLAAGCRDLDMVMNIGAFKAGDTRAVAADIAAVVKAAAPYKVPFKVIIEVGVLTEEEILDAAKIAADSGATFVKT
ncbi:MAG: deoxyribose-phosphate aldolase, partial [Candidatus Competibacteraceae bacterium]|nr:deoxyribose-phosphate aldolase [Candidatus Competibacteraceae bacterium]